MSLRLPKMFKKKRPSSYHLSNCFQRFQTRTNQCSPFLCIRSVPAALDTTLSP